MVIECQKFIKLSRIAVMVKLFRRIKRPWNYHIGQQAMRRYFINHPEYCGLSDSQLLEKPFARCYTAIERGRRRFFIDIYASANIIIIRNFIDNSITVFTSEVFKIATRFG